MHTIKNVWKIAESLVEESGTQAIITFSPKEIELIYELIFQVVDHNKGATTEDNKMFDDILRKFASRRNGR